MTAPDPLDAEPTSEGLAATSRDLRTLVRARRDLLERLASMMSIL